MEHTEKRIEVDVKSYPAFVKAFYPIMFGVFAGQTVSSDKVSQLLIDHFGFDVVIKPGSKLWHVEFTEKSFNHFMLAYG